MCLTKIELVKNGSLKVAILRCVLQSTKVVNYCYEFKKFFAHRIVIYKFYETKNKCGTINYVQNCTKNLHIQIFQRIQFSQFEKILKRNNVRENPKMSIKDFKYSVTFHQIYSSFIQKSRISVNKKRKKMNNTNKTKIF